MRRSRGGSRCPPRTGPSEPPAHPMWDIPLDSYPTSRKNLFMGQAGSFKYVTRVRPDAKGRITLGRLGKDVSSFRVAIDSEGRVLLEPFVEIPAREQWLYESPEAYASVHRGLEEAGRGETISLGSFGRRATKARKPRK